MQQFEFIVKNPTGIHARPAGELVRLARTLTSKMCIIKNDTVCDLKSVVKVMSLGVKCGETATFTVEGDNELSDAAELLNFLTNNL